MTLLVIENYPNTGLGALGRKAARMGVSWETVRAHGGEAIPQDIDGFSGLIVLGGAQNALADEEYPHLPGVCSLIRGFHSVDRPVLGICLGCQLVARAFDGGNILNQPIEFGWHEVLPTRKGKSDPLFKALGNGGPLFHWHADTVSLPDGAVHLAQSAMTPIQAFRMGRATYAVQFHFETALADVRTWSEVFADDIRAHTPDWSERIEVEAARYAKRADALGEVISEAFLELV